MIEINNRSAENYRHSNNSQQINTALKMRQLTVASSWTC